TSRAEITSVSLPSMRRIRGLQFASQETDPIQVLKDPDFLDESFSRWFKYGDATAERIGPNDVKITRGWFGRTWGDLEIAYPSYADIDGVLFSDLEGDNAIAGSAEGGITSEPYSPSGSGRLLAKARISAPAATSAPISLEIVSSYDDR